MLRIQSHAVVAGVAPGTSRLAKIQKVSSFPDGPAGDGEPSSAQPARRFVRRAKTDARRSPSRLGEAEDTATSSSGESTGSLPLELGLAAFVDDISFSYFFHSYGWINMHSILLQDEAMRGHFVADGGMAYDCLRALSYGLLGRDRHIQSLQDTAQRLYGNAVRGLRLKLGSTSKEELAALVKPIAIMGSYSVSPETSSGEDVECYSLTAAQDNRGG